MAVTSPVLDLVYIETFSPNYLGIGDVSQYPDSFNPINPSIAITPPGFPKVTTSFQVGNLNIYNSDTLGITCNFDGSVTKLPDGIYQFTYTLNPAYQYFVNKSFMRTNLIEELLDDAYLKVDINQCIDKVKREDKLILEQIKFYVEKAVACANRCANTLAMDLYRKAERELADFIHDRQRKYDIGNYHGGMY
jgi:hypothetical protein